MIKETAAARIEIVSELVSAYISNNHVAAADLPALISNVYGSLSSLTNGTSATAEIASTSPEKPTAAQIRKSVTRDALISFIDGKPYKTLKRHLTKNGFDPASYRAQFGLPANYPMVAAAYSEIRSGLAKSLGLGVQTGRHVEAEEAASTPKGRKKAA